MRFDQDYVDMCREAEEIQSMKMKAFGEFCFPKLGFSASNIRLSECSVKEQKEAIWTPRQDQLQEMIEAKPNPYFYYGLDGIEVGLFTEGSREADYWYKFATFEQCWLALVMREKYGKIWDFENKQWTKKQ